jgi:aminoglycoside phosphotransferase (APT) family kinase protein
MRFWKTRTEVCMSDVEQAPWLDTLGTWLREQGLVGPGPVTLAPITGGSQNELWQVSSAGTRLVLRRPPAGAAAGRVTEFAREKRVLAALADTDVPHARLAASCDDDQVIGSPFYLMHFVDGWSPASSQAWPAPYDGDLSARPGLAFELVRGAALLSKVDWQTKALEGFGRPDGFHERQVDRWLGFLSAYQFRELPGLDEAAAWLRTHLPRSYRPGILHGDYQFANVMYEDGAPAELAAIIDWEMTTVGDPLLDLGWVLISWGAEADDMTYARYLDHAGMPERDDLLEHYATISGRPVDEIDYYVVLARFKLGIVLEKSVARARAGGRAHPSISHFEPLVLELIRKAAELTKTTSLR